MRTTLILIFALSSLISISAHTPCDCERCNLSHLSQEEIDELWESISPSDSLIAEYNAKFPARPFEPRVFSGFRSLHPVSFQPAPFPFSMDARENAYDRDYYAGILYQDELRPEDIEDGDEVIFVEIPDSLAVPKISLSPDSIPGPDYKIIPQWLAVGLRAERLRQDILYRLMTDNPKYIQYAYWDLPVPPRLPEEDYSFKGFLSRLELPKIDTGAAIIPTFTQNHINWLHTFSTGLQLSQAYISSNWYQGGNNYLAFLYNFNWNVTLNTVFHPNLLFVSDVSYKLAVNSNPDGSLHKYSISQDLFQYNLKTGLKAFNKWFYSFNLMFKTQFFTSYPSDSEIPGAKFLSPSELNLGLGMTYNTSGLKGKLKFAASVSPISYNLKACPSMEIDHTPFNIPQDKKTASEIGSNAEFTLNWNISSNISWKSRLFLFSDYHYFLADWENTFNFTINRFLSTQLYIHPRYDSSSNRTSSNWRYWQLKEILSFGLSYTFSTKP